MRVIHFAEFAPHRCGLYHTTKDLVKAEKGVGIDSHFVNVKGEKGICKVLPGGEQDGKLTTSDVKVAYDADVLVRHTSIPNDLENAGIPIVMAVHGRPESSLLLDEKKIIPVIEALYNKGRDARYKAFFTYWREHLPFWSTIIPENKLHYVPAMVDLMEWRPGGKKYHFGEFNGEPNILICDIWREDKNPFECVMAVREFIKKHCPKGRLHIAAGPTGNGANAFYIALRKEKVLGYVSGQVRAINELYQAADVVVTPHTIATRVVREALATGTPLVCVGCQDYTPYYPNETQGYPLEETLSKWWRDFKVHRVNQIRQAREIAENCFNLRKAGLAAQKIYEQVLERKSNRRKVLLDIGGHVGETVRRFYKQVGDAQHWDIYTFEPHPECFKKLQHTLRFMKNVRFLRIAVGGPKDGSYMRKLFLGNINQGDGNTLLKNKTTGNIDYANPINVRSELLSWFITDFNIQPNDYVVLKMNIEGGEYEIMEDILKENLMGFFNQIYVQLHKHKLDHSKFNEYTLLEHKFAEEAKEHNVQLFMTEKGMARFQCEVMP